MTFAFHRRHRAGTACAGLALATALIAMAPAAHATNRDEVVSGDLSGLPSAPTTIGDLTPGANRISGATVPSGTFDADKHSYSILDNDYVTFNVPAGYALTQIIVDNYTVIQPMDRLFFAIARGLSVAVDPKFTSATGLLGWTLVGSSMIGNNVLPDLGASAPPDFPPIGGATGFTGPLGSGSYTLWMLDGDSAAAYDFKLVVAAVPEPASWAMMLAGFGLIGATLRRRARRIAMADAADGAGLLPA